MTKSEAVTDSKQKRISGTATDIHVARSKGNQRETFVGLALSFTWLRRAAKAMGKVVNVAGGAVSLFLGLILWILFSFMGAIEEIVSGFNPTLYTAMAASFFLMIGGPILFWVVLPVAEWYRSRRKKAQPAATMQMRFCPSCGAQLLLGDRFCRRCGRGLYGQMII